MRRLIAGPVTLAAGVLAASAVPAAFADSIAPPFIDHTEWVSDNDRFGLPSLRVYPTPSARVAAARLFGFADADPSAAAAWREVLVRAPDADTPGMREQFLCHWQFAELSRPGKLSWNLEPWRPVVDDATMVGSSCNPGAVEEAF